MPEHAESGDVAPDELRKVLQLVGKLVAQIRREHPPLLTAILERRQKHETLEAIAAAEREGLEAIGALTDAVRWTIVRDVCKAELPEADEEAALHAVRSRAAKLRRPSFTADEHARSVRAKQIYPWTPEIDAALAEAFRTIVHEKGHRAGMPDWKAIAVHMNKRFSTAFTGKQWMSRYQNQQIAKK